MAKEQNLEKVELTPIVKSLKGSFRLPKNFDCKKELVKSLAKKYYHYLVLGNIAQNNKFLLLQVKI